MKKKKEVSMQIFYPCQYATRIAAEGWERLLNYIQRRILFYSFQQQMFKGIQEFQE